MIFPHKKAYLLLLFIIIFASILRFYNNNYHLPFTFNIEEPTIMDNAVQVADGNLQHGIILRGSLPYYVTGGVIKLITIIKPSMLSGYKNIAQAYKTDISSFYVIGRSISGIYSVLEVLLVFLLGSLVFNTSVGLLAAFFASISSLSIQYAHAVVPDTALSSTILLTIFLTALAYSQNNLLIFLLAAGFIGLSTAQKFPGILVLPTYILFLINSKVFKSLNCSKKILVSISSVAISSYCYFLAYPFICFDLDKLLLELSIESRQIQGGWGPLLIKNVSYLERFQKYLFYWLNYGTGTFMLIFGFFGLLIATVRKKTTVILLSSFIIIFLIGISIPLPHYAKWIIPAVPLVCIFSAYAVYFLITKIKLENRILRISFCFVFILFISSAPLFKSIFKTVSYKGSDTRIKEIEWVTNNNIEESKILRDVFTGASQKETVELLNNIPITSLNKYEYFIASNFYYDRYFRFEDIYPQGAAKYRYVFSNFPKIVEFRPQVTQLNINDLEFLLSYKKWILNQTNGPVISIYKLSPNKSFRPNK